MPEHGVGGAESGSDWPFELGGQPCVHARTSAQTTCASPLR